MDAKILIKVNRLSAWILFVLMIMYFVSGYGLTGRFGLDAILQGRTAHKFHTILHAPLLIFFIIHSGISIYFAMRRWGWITSRKE